MPAVSFMSPLARPGLALNLRGNAESSLTPSRKALLLASKTPQKAADKEEPDEEPNEEFDKDAEELKELVNSDDEPLKATDDEKVSLFLAITF